MRSTPLIWRWQKPDARQTPSRNSRRPDAAVEQQRYLTIAREFSQAGDRMDDLRRETVQQLGANREGIEHRLDKVRETVDAPAGCYPQGQ